jgi:hypothetical protein
VDGELLLGMMWRSPKALDLLRDDRCVLHSCTADRMGTEGDFKLYGRARDQQEATVQDAYRRAVRQRIDWEPPGPFHLYAIDIVSAGFNVFGDGGYGLAWDPDRGLHRWPQRDA